MRFNYPSPLEKSANEEHHRREKINFAVHLEDLKKAKCCDLICCSHHLHLLSKQMNIWKRKMRCLDKRTNLEKRKLGLVSGWSFCWWIPTIRKKFVSDFNSPPFIAQLNSPERNRNVKNKFTANCRKINSSAFTLGKRVHAFTQRRRIINKNVYKKNHLRAEENISSWCFLLLILSRLRSKWNSIFTFPSIVGLVSG